MPGPLDPSVLYVQEATHFLTWQAWDANLEEHKFNKELMKGLESHFLIQKLKAVASCGYSFRTCNGNGFFQEGPEKNDFYKIKNYETDLHQQLSGYLKQLI